MTDVFSVRETTTENTSGAGDSLVPRPSLFALDGAVEKDSCQWHLWSKTSLFTFEFLWHIFIKDNFFGTNFFVVQPDLWYGSRRAELLKWPLTMIMETTAWLHSISSNVWPLLQTSLGSNSSFSISFSVIQFFSLSRRMIQSSNFHQLKRVNLKEETRTFIVLQTELTPYYFEFRIFTDKNWHWVGLSSCNLRDCNRMAFSFHILFMFGQGYFLCVCVSFYFWCNDLVMIPLGLSIDNDIFRP